MANANDGTTLNQPGVPGGDVISTEDIPLGAQRGDAALPLTDYKLPRSKIALGTYDQDSGDVSYATPLPTESRRERTVAESNLLVVLDSNLLDLRTRGSERVGNLVSVNRGGR